MGSLLLNEVLNPFYIFQIFAFALWMWDGYRTYACCILVVSSLSVAAELVDNYRNNVQIRKMARYTCDVSVVQGLQADANSNPDSDTQTASHLTGAFLSKIESSNLVPGDIMEVPEQCALPCDLILLTGSAIVNESMLTGESVPVMKSSLPVLSS